MAPERGSPLTFAIRRAAMAALACEAALQRGERRLAMRFFDELHHLLQQIEEARPSPGKEALERARAESRIALLRRKERRLERVCTSLRQASECN